MLTVVTPQEAVDIILSCVKKTPLTQAVGLYEACGRVAAEDIMSREDLPAFTRSSVDGLAVRSADTFGCTESMPAMLEYKGRIHMGREVSEYLSEGCCMEIPTGGMLPAGADAAVMVEYTEDIGDSFRYVLKPCAMLENVIRKGEDCKTGDIAVLSGTVLGAKNTAILAALGISEVKATVPPTVGIISTGDEIIEFSKKPLSSQVRDINSVTLYSCLTQSGCRAKVYPIVPDEEALLLAAVKNAVHECDCLLISGGSSVGELDAVYRVLSALGKIKFHGIAVKPGKPTMFAMLGETPVFGLPGHPAAAFFAYHFFVKPAIRKMLGSNEKDICVEASSAQNIPSNHGRQETVAVKLCDGLAVALFAKSGVVSVLSQADGYVTVGRNDEGILKGDKVMVTLF